MSPIAFSNQHALNDIDSQQYLNLTYQVKNIHEQLHYRNQHSSELLGWMDWPANYDRDEFEQIAQTADEIREHSDILLVIGIGGSYLGTRAAIEMLNHSFQHLLKNHQRKAPQIIFAGHHLSSSYIQELFDVLDGQDISINIISKSGKTTEPAVAFRIFRQYLEKIYDKETAKKRIFVTTDQTNGPLKALADEKGYKTFHIPRNIGGRYSVLTAVGLLPMAVNGINIYEVMKGAQTSMNHLSEAALEHNPAYQYAASRYLLYNQGKTLEMLVSFEPRLQSFGEWWKQLFGESEGKEQQGIFPALANFTTDLHAIGQYIQEGRRDLFETILHVNQIDKDITFPSDNQNIENLNDLSGKTLQEMNQKAFQASMLAHQDGGVPNLVIELPDISAHTFGALVFFFEKACAMSANLFNVNPFDQPGVEAYKHNMSALLGVPGLEKERLSLENRLNTC